MDQITVIVDAVEHIKPILAGKGPEVQGAILVELLSIWLAGHVVSGDPKATVCLRRRLLKIHAATALELVPLNEVAP